jgi:TetR/AcrR family transcriptional regulator, acrAB operon repressor
MKRTKEEAAVTHSTLLRSALKVFSQNGYASTTLEDVAKEAGVTRGAIYWHFGSKVELYNALMEEYSTQGGRIVQAAAAEGGSLPEILGRIFIRLLTAVATDPTLQDVMEISMFKTERTGDLAVSQQQQLERGQVLLNGIAAAMQQGIVEGVLRSDVDPYVMGRAFLAFQNGIIYQWLQDPISFSLVESAPKLAEIYLKGILAA